MYVDKDSHHESELLNKYILFEQSNKTSNMQYANYSKKILKTSNGFMHSKFAAKFVNCQ